MRMGPTHAAPSIRICYGILWHKLRQDAETHSSTIIDGTHGHIMCCSSSLHVLQFVVSVVFDVRLEGIREPHTVYAAHLITRYVLTQGRLITLGKLPTALPDMHDDFYRNNLKSLANTIRIYAQKQTAPG
jgi:hypothetical protein